MMKRFLAAMCLLLIAGITFTGNAIAVATSAQEGGQNYVGYSLLIISGGCIAGVLFIFLWMERDSQYSKKTV